jgi:hypothetical protein
MLGGEIVMLHGKVSRVLMEKKKEKILYFELSPP